MNMASKRIEQLRKSHPVAPLPQHAPQDQLQDRMQKFRLMVEPTLCRARQLGLNRVQIREIITSLL
jgi:hypothetical protein